MSAGGFRYRRHRTSNTTASRESGSPMSCVTDNHLPPETIDFVQCRRHRQVAFRQTRTNAWSQRTQDSMKWFPSGRPQRFDGKSPREERSIRWRDARPRSALDAHEFGVYANRHAPSTNDERYRSLYPYLDRNELRCNASTCIPRSTSTLIGPIICSDPKTPPGVFGAQPTRRAVRAGA